MVPKDELCIGDAIKLAMPPLIRERLATTVTQTAINFADGYRREGRENPTKTYTAEDCATAANNAVYFILVALGYSHDEIIQGTKVCLESSTTQ